MNIQLTPVIKNLLIINVLMFLATVILKGDNYALFIMNTVGYPPFTEYFKIWQPITSMFMHASIGHIFFNMFGLIMFGPRLEMSWGPKRFLSFYIITGLGAFLAHFLIAYIQAYQVIGPDFDRMAMYLSNPNYYVLGASGAVYGVLTAYALRYPNDMIMLLFPPIPIKVKWAVMGFIGIELFNGITNTGSGIAHFAHLGGALTAFILLKIWQKRRQQRNQYFQ